MRRMMNVIRRISPLALMLPLLIVFVTACGSTQSTTTDAPTAAAAETSVTSAPTTTAVSSTSTTADTPSGIVAWLSDDYTVELKLIDPDTGAVTPWRTFDAKAAGLGLFGLETFVRILALPSGMGRSVGRYCFSQDYSCVTASSNGHVGWITADGKFVDVTALVSPPQSDFADAPDDSSPVFGKDGMFYWWDRLARKFKRVDPSQLDPAGLETVSGNEVMDALGVAGVVGGTDRYLSEGMYKSDKGLFADWGFSDWIDGETYLADRLGSGNPMSIVRGSTTPDPKEWQRTPVLPESQRHNWNPIASPDGERIAFFSRNANDLVTYELFVVSRNGGDPVRVDTDCFDFITRAISAGQAVDKDVRGLLDWL